jgi:type II secretory pathway component PulM
MQAFSRLSESEKRLVSLLAVVVVVLVVGGLAVLMSSQVEKSKKRVQMRTDELAQLDQLREKYEEASQAERRSQNKLHGTTTSLFSLIQKSATEVGLSVPDLQERRTPVKDSDITETTVDVNLKEVSIDKLQTLLEKIEGKRGDGNVKVTKLKVKTRFDNPEMLEVAMTVSTWKASDKSAPEKPAAPGGAP